MSPDKGNPLRPPYGLGYLGLIPLVGAFVGVWMIFQGLFRYKDRKFTLLGIACVGVTVLVYFGLYYGTTHGMMDKNIEQLTFHQINSLVKDIEFYKLKHLEYPASLEELKFDDSTVATTDPFASFGKAKNVDFQYQRSKETFILFSVGKDGRGGTADDIYPTNLLHSTQK